MTTLDHLILQELNPNLPEFKSTLQHLQALETTVKTLEETLKDAIFEKVMELALEDRVSCYIKNYETHLIYLSNCIVCYKDKSKATLENSLLSAYVLLMDQLAEIVDGLLYFLNSYFAKYFDQDKEVPDMIREKVKKRFALKLMEISQLGDFLHDRLLKTVLLPAFEFQNDEPENIVTFGKIIYLEALLNEVIIVLKTEEENKVQEVLKWKLIYLNFNSLLFFCFMQKEMKETVGLNLESQAKVRVLTWYSKQIKQAGEKTGFILNPKNKPIGGRLIDWIKEEISYIEKYPATNCNSAIPEFQLEKIKVKPSVQQMGAVIRMMICVLEIPEKEQKKLAKGFTILFKTHQAETISEHSLYNKSKNIETGTSDWALEKLTEMTALFKELL